MRKSLGLQSIGKGDPFTQWFQERDNPFLQRKSKLERSFHKQKISTYSSETSREEPLLIANINFDFQIGFRDNGNYFEFNGLKLGPFELIRLYTENKDPFFYPGIQSRIGWSITHNGYLRSPLSREGKILNRITESLIASNTNIYDIRQKIEEYTLSTDLTTIATDENNTTEISEIFTTETWGNSIIPNTRFLAYDKYITPSGETEPLLAIQKFYDLTHNYIPYRIATLGQLMDTNWSDETERNSTIELITTNIQSVDPIDWFSGYKK